MRNAAFAQLGDTNLADGVVAGHLADVHRRPKAENEPNPGEIARRVQGHLHGAVLPVPELRARRHDSCWTPNGAPIQNGVWTANFDCIIPASATTGAGGSARPSLYGHGLFGDAGEVASGPQRSLSQGHDIVQCATDEIGMSETDVPSAIAALQNLSRVPEAHRPPAAGPARRALPRAGR